MEEYKKLENLFAEVQLIEDAADREAIGHLYQQAGVEAWSANLEAPEFFAVMEKKNLLLKKVDDLKLKDFFKGYEQKMMGGDQ